MTVTDMRTEQAIRTPAATTCELKLEVVIIPVSDVDRAKRFYGNLGWRLDADFAAGDAFRVVQFTPPGSACSIHFGIGVTSASPGSAREYLVVSDIEAARAELVARGAEVGEIFHRGIGEAPQSGRDPAGSSYVSFATFSDPDGNGWMLQEINARLPGRGFGSLDVATLTDLLKEAEQHHGDYEPTAPKHHWSGFYAAYIIARQGGKSPEDAVKAGVAQVEGVPR